MPNKIIFIRVIFKMWLVFKVWLLTGTNIAPFVMSQNCLLQIDRRACIWYIEKGYTKL